VAEEVVRGSTLGYHFETGVFKEPRNPFSQQNRVVGEDYAHAAEASTSRAERREVRREPRDLELEKPLGPVQAGQLVLAQVLELVRRVDRVAGPFGEQDLPAATSLSDPCRAMHVQPEVRVVTEIRLTGVHTHPHTQDDAFGPRMLGERALGCHGGVGGAPGFLEHDEELVPPVVDHLSTFGLDGLPKKTAVLTQDLGVAVAETLEELRRAFDVGEEESDGAMW
jgi:hypothetical protein